MKMAYKPLDEATKRHILGEAGPVFLCAIGQHLKQPIFLANLVKHKVITPEESRDISDMEKTSEKSEMLLNHLYQCSIRQFIDFCIFLHNEADRADILTDMFGIDVNHLREQRDQSPFPYPSSSNPRQRTTNQSPHPSVTGLDQSNTMQPEVVQNPVGDILQTTPDSIKKELQDDRPRLVGLTGLGVLAGREQFIAKARSIQLLEETDIQEIQAATTPAKKAALLMTYLLSSSPGCIISFAWVLVQEKQGHQLPKSLTADVKRALRGYRKEYILKLAEELD